MAIPAKQRWILYAIALALTLIAVRWAGGQDEGEPKARTIPASPRAERPARETPSEAPRAETGRAEGSAAIRLDLLGERGAGAPPAQNPFQSQSWEPPPQVVAPPPPPRPQAPPLPFKYLGKIVDDAQTTLFLANEDRNYVVRTGDTIDGTYRIDEIGNESALFTYLPLKTKQTLPFASAAQPAGDGGASERRGGRRRPVDDDEDD